MYGSTGHVDLIVLVDTGADNSVFPMSIARDLGIERKIGAGPAATAFGGQRIALSFADVILAISQDGADIRWRARIYFADFPDGNDTAVIAGHEVFLDFFTAQFIGSECVLDLQPNDDMPRVGSFS